MFLPQKRRWQLPKVPMKEGGILSVLEGLRLVSQIFTFQTVNICNPSPRQAFRSMASQRRPVLALAT